MPTCHQPPRRPAVPTRQISSAPLPIGSTSVSDQVSTGRVRQHRSQGIHPIYAGTDDGETHEL